ncbi:MAG: Crp/Fnr family transcriptional regulator [Chloroflexota bacterium]
MISHAQLRQYPLFGALNAEQLKAISMVSSEKEFKKGEVVFQENTAASKLFVVVEGEVDLFYGGGGEGAIVDAPVGSIAPGEIFGVSSLLEPYRYIDTAKAAKKTKVIEMDSSALRALCAVDHHLGHELLQQILQAALERLKYTQIELAAARA